MSAIAIEQVFRGPGLPLPEWVRGILFAVADTAQAQSPTEADRSDVASVRRGDGDAYARIIRRHQPTIARRMTRFARDRRTIEELVHDCFVEAFLSLGGYRNDAPLEHWLTKIATRVGYRHWKTERRDRDRRQKLNAQSSTESVEAKTNDSAELANYLLDQLSPRDRLAITLLHLEGRSVSEAARMAGWSQTMMKVQAFRARKKLKKMLEKQGFQDG